MAEATRDRVRAAIQELGFVRNESARRLRQSPKRRAATPSRPRAFGIVVEDLTNPYATDVARGAELTLNDAGHDALWLSSDHSPQKEKRSLELLVEHQAAGVLITPVGLDTAGIDRLRARSDGIVVVLIDHTGQDVCSVQVDHVAGGDIAAAHLMALGHEHMAFVTGAPAPLPVVERGEGAARTLAKAGAGELVTLMQQALSPTEGQAAAHSLMDMDPRPTGVFCANDLLAIGLINELLRLGVRVPDDIAVIGYDDIELATSAAVPLTTVRQPRLAVGEEAAELALAEFAEGDAHQHRQVILTPELIIRESA